MFNWERKGWIKSDKKQPEEKKFSTGNIILGVGTLVGIVGLGFLS